MEIIQNNSYEENIYAICGMQLREARINANYSLKEISDKLKIRKMYLEAIENGNWELVPSETYARGYTKLYCNYLGVDYWKILEKEHDDNKKIGDANRNKQLSNWQQKSQPSSWLVYLSLFFSLLILAFINFYI